jgi:hypothetical protein
VNLVNLEGTAIFGPGSEWFWQMAQFVLVAVTLIGIYYQLRIARNANAFEQMSRIANESGSERMSRSMLEILLALRDGVKPEKVPSGAASFIFDFWEGMAPLVRAGHVDRWLVHEYLGTGCRWWWAALAPYTRRVRIELGSPRVGEQFEWLAGVMAEIDGNAGVSPLYDDAYLAGTLHKRIHDEQDRVRLAEDLRAVILRPMSSGVTPAPAPAAPRKRRSVAQ